MSAVAVRSVPVSASTPSTFAVIWSLVSCRSRTVTVCPACSADRRKLVVPDRAPSTSCWPSRRSCPVPVASMLRTPFASRAVAVALSDPAKPGCSAPRSGTSRSSAASSAPWAKLPRPSAVSCGLARRSVSTSKRPSFSCAMAVRLVRPLSAASSSLMPSSRSVASPETVTRRAPGAPVTAACAVSAPAIAGSAAVRLDSRRSALRSVEVLVISPCAAAVRRCPSTRRSRISIPCSSRRALAKIDASPAISRSSCGWFTVMSVPVISASASKPWVSTV